SHAFTLGAQIVDVERRRSALESDALDDVESETLQSAVLHRVVGHKSHRRDTEVHEDLRPDAVFTTVDGKAELQVSVHGVHPTLLEGVGADLVPESDAATFVTAQVHDHT